MDQTPSSQPSDLNASNPPSNRPAIEALKLICDKRDRITEEVEVLRMKVEKARILVNQKEEESRRMAVGLEASETEYKKNLGHKEISPATDTLAEADINNKLKSLLIRMSDLRIPLFRQKREVLSNRTLLYIHTVKIHYMKHLKDGELERFAKSKALTACFRLTNKTSLQELKLIACNFWVMIRQEVKNPDEMSLRASNKARLGVIEEGEKPVHEILLENRVNPELWLIWTNPWSTELFSGQDDFCMLYLDFREGGPSTIAIKLTSEEIREGAHRNLMVLSETFPGLNIKTKVKKVKEIEEKVNQYTRCPSCTAILLLIVFTLVVTLERIDIQAAYWMNQSILNPIDSIEAYSAIASVTDMTTFFTTQLPYIFFPNAVNNRTNWAINQLVGPLRLRQVRSIPMDCPYITDIKDECYTDYSSSTKETSDIATGDTPWKWFHSVSETHIYSTVIFTQTPGKIAEYDGSGYIYDFDRNTTAQNFAKKLEDMIDSSWFDLSTRALFVHAVGYEASTDIWWILNILIEIGASGGLVVNPLKAQVFRPNVISDRAGDGVVTVVDVCRLLLSFYLPYSVWTRFAHRISRVWRFDWKTLYSFNAVRDICIFVLIITGFGMATSLNLDTGQVLRDDVFFDFQDIAKKYSVFIQINIVTLILLILRFTMSMHFSTKFTLFHKSMRKVLF